MSLDVARTQNNNTQTKAIATLHLLICSFVVSPTAYCSAAWAAGRLLPSRYDSTNSRCLLFCAGDLLNKQHTKLPSSSPSSPLVLQVDPHPLLSTLSRIRSIKCNLGVKGQPDLKNLSIIYFYLGSLFLDKIFTCTAEYG